MTAEVCVMNSIGVALAADSAVTITNTAGKAPKIFTSADKIFEISEDEPIGVMVYGGSSFVGLPWEVIIKTFRTDMKGRHFKSVSECGEALILWMSDNTAVFSEKSQISSIQRLYSNIFFCILNEIKEVMDEKAEKQNVLYDEDIPVIVDQVINAWLDYVKQIPGISSMDKKRIRRFNKHDLPEIKMLQEYIFEEIPISAETNGRIEELICEIAKREFFGSQCSGIVIAGYGEEEYLPAMVQYEIEEMISNAPRYRCPYKCSIEIGRAHV